jgi:hypothetical protein
MSRRTCLVTNIAASAPWTASATLPRDRFVAVPRLAAPRRAWGTQLRRGEPASGSRVKCPALPLDSFRELHVVVGIKAHHRPPTTTVVLPAGHPLSRPSPLSAAQRPDEQGGSRRARPASAGDDPGGGEAGRHGPGQQDRRALHGDDAGLGRASPKTWPRAAAGSACTARGHCQAESRLRGGHRHRPRPGSRLPRGPVSGRLSPPASDGQGRRNRGSGRQRAVPRLRCRAGLPVQPRRAGAGHDRSTPVRCHSDCSTRPGDPW